MASQKRSIQTRQRILQATAETINELSYEKATLVDIATRAGMTTGTFYFHFGSKEQTAHALIRAQNTYSQRRAEDIVARGYSAVETMLRVSAGLVQDIVRDPVVRAGIRLTTEIHILDTPPLQVWVGWTRFNETHLRSGVREGDLRPDLNVASEAEVVTAMIAGIHTLSSLLEDIPGMVGRAKIVWEQFVRANATAPDEWLPLIAELFTAPPEQFETPSSWLSDPTLWDTPEALAASV